MRDVLVAPSHSQSMRVLWMLLARRAWPLFLARTLTLAMTLASFSLVGRYLGPQRFGIYSLAYTLPILLAPLVDFGLSAVVAREIARGASPRWALGGVVASWMALPVVWTALVGGAWIAGLRDSALVLVFVSSMQLPAFTLRCLEARLVAEKRTREVGLFAVAGNAASLVAVATTVWLRAPAPVVMAAHVSYLVLYYGLIGFRGVQGLWPLTGSLRLARGALAEAWPLGLGGALASVTERGGVAVVFLAAGAAAAGLYGASHRFYEIAVMISGVAMTVVFPHLSEVGTIPSVFARHATTLLRGLMVGSGIAALGVAALAPVLLAWTFGTEFVGAAPILTALSPAIANTLPGNLVAYAGIARGLRSRFLVGAIGAALVAVAGGFGLSLVAGPVGASLALAAAGMLAVGWIAAGLQAESGESPLRTYAQLSAAWWLAFGMVVVGARLHAFWARGALATAAACAYAWYAYGKR